MPRLKKVHPGTDLGYRRVRAGSGFRYTDADGAVDTLIGEGAAG